MDSLTLVPTYTLSNRELSKIYTGLLDNAYALHLGLKHLAEM